MLFLQIAKIWYYLLIDRSLANTLHPHENSKEYVPLSLAFLYYPKAFEMAEIWGILWVMEELNFDIQAMYRTLHLG